MAARPTFDPRQARREYLAAADEADRRRVSGLARWITARTARGVVMTRMRAGQEGPEAEALDRRIATNQELLRVLTAEYARVRQAAPTVTRQEWVLYGAVTDAQGAPIAGQTVALFDGVHRLQGADSPPTDAEGRFAIRLPLSDLPGGARGKAADETSPTPSLRVRVLDPRGRTLHEHDEPIAAQAGEAVYLEMAIPPVPKRKR